MALGMRRVVGARWYFIPSGVAAYVQNFVFLAADYHPAAATPPAASAAAASTHVRDLCPHPYSRSHARMAHAGSSDPCPFAHRPPPAPSCCTSEAARPAASRPSAPQADVTDVEDERVLAVVVKRSNGACSMPLTISSPSVRACCESGRTSASDEPRHMIGQHPTRTTIHNLFLHDDATSNVA